MMQNKTEKIQELNDTFRRNLLTSRALGHFVLTAGVAALMPEQQLRLLVEVCCFEDFKTKNDPYNEHDFGKISFNGKDYFFKIDYYDKQLQMHSEDPSDPSKTERVLTVMRAEEY